ncbi:TBC1 domain family member 10B, partial [Octopus bimaculoides]
MANARPEKSTSFDEDSPVEDRDEDMDDLFSNGKQNGGPPTRSVDRYGFIGGDHYTSPEETPRLTLEMIRKREVKWIDMFENWEKWMTKRFKKVKVRCRKGIPPSLRARAWQHLCGSSFLMDQNAGKFDEYLSKAGDPKWIEDIKKDLHRQFPLHEIFALRGGHGQEDLFRILKAYTIHNPQEGYCQAQGPIAAVLLMHMPAEQAFWCLVSICEKYLPGYYSLGLEAVHIDGDVLFGLLKKSSPLIYKHLKKQRIEPILYMTEWFMCIFSRTLPWTAVLRVWDMFFCEGVKVVLRIALILFKLILGTPGKLSECPSLYLYTLGKVSNIAVELEDLSLLLSQSLKLNIDEKDMEKEHQRQITKRRNLREKALKEASATKGKKEKKKLLGKLTKKDSENKLLLQQQQTPGNVMLLSSQKLPETTQKAQPKMALPISASSPTVGQMTATATSTTTNTTTTSNPQRWSADLDAHSNINSHVLYASQISTEDESQRSVEQLPGEMFAHDEEQQAQETLAPVHSKSVLVPAEEIRQKLAGPEMMAPRAIEVTHTSTAAVSEAVPARVLPIHLNEQAEVVTASEAATLLHIEGVVEPTLANARHASDVAAPEVRMAMPQPQSPAEVNSTEVRPEESHSQTTSHTSQSDPTRSEPAHSGPATHAGGMQSDVAQPKPKSKSKSRSRSKPVKIELVHSEG